MKRLSFLFTLLLLSGGWLYSQSLDDILVHHSKAMGYDQLSSIKSIRIKGKNIRGSRESSFNIWVKGDKFRYESDFMNRKMIQVYDGGKGWFLSPRTGDVQEMTQRQLQALRERTRIGGPLSNWQKIRNNLTYIGKTDLEGTEVYKIKYVRPNASVTWFYIDPDSYVLLKETSKLSFNGNEMKRSVVFSNYKKVNGVMIPFSRKTVMEGMPQRGGRRRGPGTISYESVDFNVSMDDALFTKESLSK